MPRIPDQDHFLNNVPPDGTSIGNKALREKLKWEEDKYWNIRDELIAEGVIKKTRGKGGAIVRIKTDTANSSTSVPATEKFKDEKALYAPLKETLEQKHTKEYRLKQFICYDTSSQGKRDTGGMWTRPDLVIVSVSTYSYYPGKVLDIISFEVKHYKNMDVSGAFETASHSRFATKSYLTLYLPTGWSDENVALARLRMECERFGVGLMHFSNPADYDTFEVLVEPDRKEADPADMDEFIRVQITDEKTKNKISEMLR